MPYHCQICGKADIESNRSSSQVRQMTVIEEHLDAVTEVTNLKDVALTTMLVTC